MHRSLQQFQLLPTPVSRTKPVSAPVNGTRPYLYKAMV